MMTLKNVLFSMFALFLLNTASAVTVENLSQRLTYGNKVVLEQVKKGEVSRTIRSYDRTAANESEANRSKYEVGQYAPLVNTNREEDPRTFGEQINSGEYGAAKLEKLTVVHVDSMNTEDLAEVQKWYTAEKIEKAEGIFTIVEFSYEAIDL